MNFYIRLAVAAALVAGAAGSIQAQMTCIANAGNPPIIRVQGTTELVGDLMLFCTGGTPTASGQPVPIVNVTLTLNTNLTSRLIGGEYMDALLLVDEPYPANPNLLPPGTGTKPANEPGQALCFSTATATSGTCNYLLGTGGGPFGTASSPYLQANAFTMYAGQQTAANQVTFYGVPIDPPGPSGQQRIIRITNIRANAAQLGLSYALIPMQVVANLTVSNSQLAIDNPQQTLAYNQRGAIVTHPPLALCGCVSHNASLVGGSGTPGFDATIKVKEGFSSVFKRRNIGLTLDGPTEPSVYDQNIPGYPYNTETGFLPTPGAIAAPAYTLSPADSGTRILLQFSNVPAAVHVFIPVNIALLNGTPQLGYPSGNTFRTSQLQLVQTQSDGTSSPGYIAVTSTATIGTTPVAEASRTGNTVYATYEVVNSDPFAFETANIPVALAFNGSATLSGIIPATVSLAPLSTTATASGNTAPIPRFSPTNTNPVSGDFDSNYVSDRVWQNDSNGQVTVHYQGFALSPPYTNSLNTQDVPGWHVVAVADFNNDGIPDLVWQDDVTREVTVYYYGGSGGAVLQGWSWLYSSPIPGWRVVAAADFNGDGVPDLVWQNDTTRAVAVDYYGGAGGAVLQSWSYIDPNGVPGWRVVGAGDFNGDGVADLVWQNDTTRQVTIYYMGGPGGASIQSWAWLDHQGVPGWTVKAVSDVNGDGIPDLLWQNDTTHQATVYYFGGPGGATFQNWAWIDQQGQPGWSIVR